MHDIISEQLLIEGHNGHKAAFSLQEWFTQKEREREARHQDRIKLWQAQCETVRQQKQDARSEQAVCCGLDV